MAAMQTRLNKRRQGRLTPTTELTEGDGALSQILQNKANFGIGLFVLSDCRERDYKETRRLERGKNKASSAIGFVFTTFTRAREKCPGGVTVNGAACGTRPICVNANGC